MEVERHGAGGRVGYAVQRREEAPSNLADRHLWQITAVRDLLWIGLGIFLLWFVYELRGVFTPILIALALAYLFNPLFAYPERRWEVPRPLTITLLLVVLTIAGAGFIAWFGPLLMEQVQTLAKKVPQYIQSLSAHSGLQLGHLPDQLLAWVSRMTEDPIGVLQPLFVGTGQAFGIIGQVIGTTTSIVLLTMLVPIYFFFFAWHFDRMIGWISHLLPASKKPHLLKIFGRMDDAVSGFFRGRLVIALITGIMYAVGWALTDVPYWFLLGMGTGFLSIIPYVSVIGWPLAILFKYLDLMATTGAQDFNWLSVFVWPSVPYLPVQFLESWVLTPLIQSQSVTVLIVVFIGGAVGGFFGLLLSIPVAACIKILFQELVLPRLERYVASH
ncbi:MAG: AI-2E family transporter [Nitrospiraceae bacterium]